jgi:hypothetical protein
MVKTFVLPVKMQLLDAAIEHKFIYFANIIYIETIIMLLIFCFLTNITNKLPGFGNDQT